MKRTGVVTALGMLLLLHCAGPERLPPPAKPAQAPPPPTVSAGADLFSFIDEGALEGFHFSQRGRLVVHTRHHLVAVDPHRPDTMRAVARPDGVRQVVATEAAPIILLRGDQVVHVLDGETLQLKRRVPMAKLVDDRSALALSPSGVWAAQTCESESAERVGCKFHSVDASGVELASFAVGGGFPMVSPNGSYVVDADKGRRNVYHARTGKRVLRRESEWFGLGDAGGAEHLFRFVGDQVVLSRGGLLEVTDLPSGRVLGSVRFAGNPYSIKHALSPDEALVATFSGNQVAWFSVAQRKLLRTVSLPKDIDTDCLSCQLAWVDSTHVQVAEPGVFATLLGVDGDAKRLDANLKGTVHRGRAFSLEQGWQKDEPRTRTPRCSIRYASGTSADLHPSSCRVAAAESGEFVAVATEHHNALTEVSVRDLRTGGEVLRVGGGAGPDWTFVADAPDVVFTAQGATDLTLVPSPSATNQPSAEPAQMQPMVLATQRVQESETHRFELSWEATGLSLAITDKRTGETKRLEHSMFPPARWRVHGSRAFLPLSLERAKKSDVLVCSYAGGCTTLRDAMPVSVAWPWILAPERSLFNAESGERRALPDACKGSAAVVSASPEIVCMNDRTDAPEHLTLFDAKAKPVFETPLFRESRAAPHSPASLPGTYAIATLRSGAFTITGSVEGRAWVVVDVARRRRALLAAQGERGIVALYPGGRYETFGEKVDAGALLRCRSGETLLPLAACRAQAELRGAWQRRDW